MTHRFLIPTDAELENLIVQVYESLPNPDQSRLSLIESKLLQQARKNKTQKNLNKIPWWIVLLLAGGFATASWFAGEQLFNKQDADTKVIELQSDDKIMKQNQDRNKQDSKPIKDRKQKDDESNDSPVIYQREVF